MKKMMWTVSAALTGLVAISNAQADDYHRYYQYMTDQKVEVAKDHVTFSFRWKKDMPQGTFKNGDEFELGVMINPKYFGAPKSGNDVKLTSSDYKTNVPCGTRDVYNYTQPQDTPEVYTNILKGCKNLDLTETQKEFVWEIATYYPYGHSDKDGNFTVVSTCPEEFKRISEQDEPYFFTYYLGTVPDGKMSSYNTRMLCGEEGYYPDWGFFWINAKVQTDTIVKKDDSKVKITDCPYLLGLPEFNVLGISNPYVPNQGNVTLLFNRGCAPTGSIPWGMADPQWNNWHNKAGQDFQCRDCDGDGLYDTDFPARMYGDRAVDCNDHCSDINVCSMGKTCGKIVPSYCSKQCGGGGCSWAIQSFCYKPKPACNGACVPGGSQSQSCLTGGGKEKRSCLDNCTWGPWQGCLSYCEPGAVYTEKCTGLFIGAEKWLCDNKGAWNKTSYCELPSPDFLASGGSNDSCPDDAECTPGDEASSLCPDQVNEAHQICNDACAWETVSECPEDECECTPGSKDTPQACTTADGQSGTKTRSCNGCIWGLWSQCTANPSCTAGETASCGNCGTMTCDNSGQRSSCLNEGTCAPGQPDSQPCNGSGTESRTCQSNCEWGNWGACSISPVCTPGDTYDQGCTMNSGQSGTQTCSCNGNGLDWTCGACQPNGICLFGDTASCGNCGSMTCDNTGEWSACQGEGACNPNGPPQTQSCNGSGTQSRSCNNSCNWGSWSACSVTPVCSAGQQKTQGCTTGANLPGSQTCTCNSDGMAWTCGSCIAKCQDVYMATISPSCQDNPNGLKLCLYTQQVSGASWKYAVCAFNASFSQNFKVILRDDNYDIVSIDTVTGSAGDSCTLYRPFSVGYINGYGTVNAAGLRAEVLLPASCAQSSCKYSTGAVDISKQCQ